MNIQPFIQSGYELLHDGTEELSRVEANGIRIDVPLLKKTKEQLKEKIRECRTGMEKHKLHSIWRKRFGHKFNLNSRDQLEHIIRKELKVSLRKKTERGNWAVDDEVLQSIDHPFVRQLEAYYRYDKTLGTFLKGIEWEICGDRLHPSFDLHTARSFRSSSSNPNFQNFPVRNKETAIIIRSLFIASPDSVLVENDFKGIEVGVSGCYHKDKNFLRYVRDPEKNDMHRDMAKQVYCLSDSDWAKLDKSAAKDARYGAKNKFVFPQFYGDYYVACARNLWEWIEKGKLKGPDGESLFKHLEKKGITELGACDPDQKPVRGTFEFHLKEIQDDFWNNRFGEYGQWRKDFYNDYLKHGYFDLLTGFRIHGVYSRNQVTNFPVQGAAFHCLLWSLVQINRELRRRGMKSMIVGQIHDSLIADVRIDELAEYQSIVSTVTQKWLRKHFDWICVPLEVEYEICPIGKPWSEKREFKFKEGQFKHPEKDIWTPNAEKFLHSLIQPAVIPDRPSAAAERGSFRSKHQVKTKLAQSKI